LAGFNHVPLPVEIRVQDSGESSTDDHDGDGDSQESHQGSTQNKKDQGHGHCGNDGLIDDVPESLEIRALRKVHEQGQNSDGINGNKEGDETQPERFHKGILPEF